jgi:hypothetical protein
MAKAYADVTKFKKIEHSVRAGALAHRTTIEEINRGLSATRSEAEVEFLQALLADCKKLDAGAKSVIRHFI